MSWSNHDSYLFEARRRVTDLLQHGPLDGGLPDVAVVLPGALRAAWGAAGALVAGLVKVRLSH